MMWRGLLAVIFLIGAGISGFLCQRYIGVATGGAPANWSGDGLNQITLLTNAAMVPMVSAGVSALAVVVSVIVWLAGKRSKGAATVLTLIGLAAAVVAAGAATYQDINIREAMIATATTNPAVTAPGWAEIMVVMEVGLLAAAIALFLAATRTRKS